MTHYRVLRPDDSIGAACEYRVVGWDREEPMTNRFEEVTCRECAKVIMKEREARKEKI